MNEGNPHGTSFVSLISLQPAHNLAEEASCISHGNRLCRMLEVVNQRVSVIANSLSIVRIVIGNHCSLFHAIYQSFRGLRDSVFECRHKLPEASLKLREQA